MVCPILISVSLAPGPYFFSASAEDEASARTDKIADKTRRGNLICIISLSHSCRSRWTDVAFRQSRQRVIFYVSLRLATQTSRRPHSKAGRKGRLPPQFRCALCRTALAGCDHFIFAREAAKLVRILLSFHI